MDEALAILRATRADFADGLIGVPDRRAGRTTTDTFDRRAAATADFARSNELALSVARTAELRPTARKDPSL